MLFFLFSFATLGLTQKTIDLTSTLEKSANINSAYGQGVYGGHSGPEVDPLSDPKAKEVWAYRNISYTHKLH